MESYKKAIISSHILDVEDLAVIGKKQHFCPYFWSIDACKDADIIFMPYNYLVDNKLRPSSVMVDGAIVIFDEAHNIENVCCDAVSFSLTAEIIAECISETQQVLDMNKPDSECLVSQKDLASLKGVLLKFEQVIDEQSLFSTDNGQHRSFAGDFIFSILEKAGINKEMKDNLMDVMQDVIRELITPEAEFQNTLTDTHRKNDKFGMEVFVRALETIFRNNFDSDDYCVNISVDNKSTFGGRSSRSLSMWCLNPGIAIGGLKKDVHTMILTSGTLSPLHSFCSELKMDFPIRLENPHLITNDQVFVGVVAKGPCGHWLSSDYRTRNTNEYKTDLGALVINVARRVPFGLLVFFVSYAHMNSCVEHWRSHYIESLTIWERLQLQKHIVIEPRKGGQQACQQAIHEYKTALKNRNGAILLAVMRGKISEGMSFSDNFARAVIITGLPFAYSKDARIVAKKKYMQKEYDRQKRMVSTQTELCLNGNQWYVQQAQRAVNQAIGRVIRHKFDYGAIILADKRFARAQNINNISKWIRPHIKQMDSFGKFVFNLQNFFKQAVKYDVHWQTKKKISESELKTFEIVLKEIHSVFGSKNADELSVVFEREGMNNNQEANIRSSPVKRRKLNEKSMKIEYNPISSSSKFDTFSHNYQCLKPTLSKAKSEIPSNNKRRELLLKQKKKNKKVSHLTCVQKERLHLLRDIKHSMSRLEYISFRTAMKYLSSHLENINNISDFDENVITPFIALFSMKKRIHFKQKLNRFIPEQYQEYYKQKLLTKKVEYKNIAFRDRQKSKEHISNAIADVQRSKNKHPDIIIGGRRPMRRTEVRMKTSLKANNRRHSPSIPSLRLKTMNTHQRSNSKCSERVKLTPSPRQMGFHAVCKQSMNSEQKKQFKVYVNEWKAFSGAKEIQKGEEQNRDKILRNILDLFLEVCTVNKMVVNSNCNGNSSKKLDVPKFKTLTKGFQQYVPVVYHLNYANVLQNHPILNKGDGRFGTKKSSIDLIVNY